MSSSLKTKTIKGTFWSGVDNIVQYSVSFVVSVILARLLTPDDYGLIGIVLIFTTICTVIINGGMSTALLRKKDVDDSDYSTAFIINIGLSIFLYLIIYICAPLIASFFGREELINLTRVASLIVIIGAVSLVQQVRLTRNIDFKTQTKITFIASILSGVLGIIMAFAGCGVWALVVQMLSSHLLRTLALCIYNKWLPSLAFNKTSFKSLFSFGWKLMAAGVLDSLWNQLYQVVIGKFYAPATLGQYTRARQFSNLFSENLTNVVQRVTFPVLSSIQDEHERLREAYRRIIKITMFITFSLMFFLGAVSEPLLYCLIGPQWDEAMHYLPYLCLIGALYPLQAINLNMLQLQGRSDLFLYLEIIKKTIAVGPLVIGALVGIYPMLYASIIVSIVCYFLNSHFPGKILGYNTIEQIKDIMPSFFVALVVAVPVYFLKYLAISFWIVLPLQLFVGAGLFFLVCEFFKISEYKEAKSIIVDIIKHNGDGNKE